MDIDYGLLLTRGYIGGGTGELDRVKGVKYMVTDRNLMVEGEHTV